VLGGSYPENHPILTTPSLFTDSPTYEDMLLLSALLGPAKPPVASESDVAEAPGRFTITGNPGSLLAVPTEDTSNAGETSIALAAAERCLVCLCDFEPGEEARKLIKCEHLFHRVCIDQVSHPKAATIGKFLFEFPAPVCSQSLFDLIRPHPSHLLTFA
jgi:hypothetical protein